MTRSVVSSSETSGNRKFNAPNTRSRLSRCCQKRSERAGRAVEWGCLSVTWPDDSLQQRHPASQKLKVCLHVVEHLQANVLSESSDRGTVWGGWKDQPESWGCSRLFPLPVPGGRYSGSVSPPTFDPCLKLTLPQASYSPWIPIIVSRIKTLSAKIFSASLIWCIPSPCEDRYSCQGKENKPKNCSPRCKSFFFSQYSSGVRMLKQSTYLPSTLRHIWSLNFSVFPSFSGHAAIWGQSLPCWAGQHQHAHKGPASCRWHNTATLHSPRFLIMPSAFILLGSHWSQASFHS